MSEEKTLGEFLEEAVIGPNYLRCCGNPVQYCQEDGPECCGGPDPDYEAISLALIAEYQRRNGEAVAYVPVHPKEGPLWASTIKSLDSDRPNYPVLELFFAPQLLPSAEPVAWALSFEPGVIDTDAVFKTKERAEEYVNGCLFPGDIEIIALYDLPKGKP